MRNGIQTFLMIGFFTGALSAYAIEDPTRPPVAEATEPKVQAAKKPKLSSILVSQGRSLAVLDGELVEVGEKVGRYRVEAILQSSVHVRGPRGSERLALPTIDKRIVGKKEMIPDEEAPVVVAKRDD